jgi:hypothetical protein
VLLLSVAKYLNAIRYSPPLWFDRLTTNGMFTCHAEFVVVERSIWGGVVNKVVSPVADAIFVLFLPTPRILRPPLVVSE